ncbi:archaetidylserine decarboxylase [Sphingomonas profundi]|uniref:archaetidylserine decarboxylase n=1 Tax=Alterirhizorhabdus profundi TaxID=2681549 RepID=UPI0012E8C800|nr:archaetidylserine decarboxylase [Sphingomonas profundi]
MTVRTAIAKIVMQEDLNFLLTNRIPRRLATRFMGWFAKIEHPLVRAPSIALWRFFSDVDMADAAARRYRSLHAAFIRDLVPGARPADPDPALLASPCDAIVGACGRIEGDRLHQIKGFPYRLRDLMGDQAETATWRDGSFVTLRLTAGMYHRFHAPHDMVVESVTYISGDTWNVNPIALKRVERLFCRNERALIAARLAGGGLPILLVPVAAILVASIRLTFLDTVRNLRVGGPRRIETAARLAKGEEMGWFEHGSTIILFVPPGFALHEDVAEGRRIRAGQPIARLPDGGTGAQPD